MVKRSLLYLRRKYKLSILLFLLLLVISFSLAVGLTVWNSIHAVVREVQQSLGTSFIINYPSVDAEDDSYFQSVTKWNGEVARVYSGQMMTQEFVDAINQINGVSNYNAERSVSLNVKDITLVEGDWKALYDLAFEDGSWMDTILLNFADMGELDQFAQETKHTYIWQHQYRTI